MGDNEVATIRTLSEYRAAISEIVAAHHGRIVDMPGDNLLAELGSAIDAVEAALAMQRELAARNAQLPEGRRMAFRVGVNLGDIITEDNRIYGDGVNIAARVESLAPVGGICVSGKVHDAGDDAALTARADGLTGYATSRASSDYDAVGPWPMPQGVRRPEPVFRSCLLRVAGGSSGDRKRPQSVEVSRNIATR